MSFLVPADAADCDWLVVREGDDLVLEECGVKTYVPEPVAVSDDINICRELDSSVGDRSNVFADRQIPTVFLM